MPDLVENHKDKISRAKTKVKHVLSPVTRKPVSGFSINFEININVQPNKMGRGLKVWI